MLKVELNTPIDIQKKEDLFNYIYKYNLWTCPDTVSGWGSTIINASYPSQWLPLIISSLEIRSILDIPCGDFHWMRELELGVDLYIGADIVNEICRNNQKRYGKTTTKFLQLDLCSDSLPPSDLIFCRDCLVHLSFFDIHMALRNIISSNFKFIITTTYNTIDHNIDINTGNWRPINLEKQPFCWPKPLAIIKDNHSIIGENDWGKCLAIWDINDITKNYNFNLKMISNPLYGKLSKLRDLECVYPQINSFLS